MSETRPLRLMILASKGSPWAPEVIRQLVLAGARIHLIHVAAEEGESYLDTANPKVKSLFESLYAQVEKVTQVKAFGKSKMRYFKIAKVLRKQAAEHPCDCLLTLYGGGFSISAYRSNVRPYYVYAVGNDVFRPSSLNQRISKHTYAKAQKIFCNGIALTAKTLEVSPDCSPENILIGVDTDQYTLSNAPTDIIQIVCLRGFQPIYDNLTILKAIQELPELNRPVRFVFVAGGSLLKESIEWADQNLSKSRREQITFLGGVSPGEIQNILAESHIAISMSLSDGTSTSLLESLACGILPILSDIKPNRPWVIEDEGLGELVEIQNPIKLAHALNQMVNNFDLLWSKRQLLRELVLSVADSSVNMGRVVQAMKSYRDS